MSWLVAHMWIALAGAGVVALLLGWSVRGALLTGRLRRAEVDRDLARVELDEARDEIEKLFAAQRKLDAGQVAQPAVAVAAAADPALEQKLAETTEALAAAQAELAALKSAPAAPAVPLPMVAAVDDGTARRIEDLEGQLKGLDAELVRTREALAAAEAARAEAEAAASSAAAVPAEAPVAAQAEPDPKLVWEVSYLRARAGALEAELAAPVVAAVPPAPAAPEPAAAPDDSAEEELARLRWRNRYLEGRLAYFEGDVENAAEEAAAAGEAPEEAGLPEAAALPEMAEEPQVAIEPQRPMSLDGPMAHPADDLTLIGGIGPKIQEVLNSLGIWHYDQIAEWTPENVAWIDDYLNFNGRVSREGWVEQAAVLVGEGAES